MKVLFIYHVIFPICTHSIQKKKLHKNVCVFKISIYLTCSSLSVALQHLVLNFIRSGLVPALCTVGKHLLRMRYYAAVFLQEQNKQRTYVLLFLSVLV